MLLLVLVSLLWAFSPGLIKGRLTGLDSAFISAVRLALALLVFLPFLRPAGLGARRAPELLAPAAAFAPCERRQVEGVVGRRGPRAANHSAAAHRAARTTGIGGTIGKVQQIARVAFRHLAPGH